MPALLVHLTVGEQTLGRQTADDALRAAARADVGAYLLGTIWPDLPYHARFGGQVVKHLLRRPYIFSEWGALFHSRKGGSFAFSLVNHLWREQLQGGPRRSVLAFLAGYLSHLALDYVGHPYVNREVQRLLPGRDCAPVVLHVEVEHYQNLFYHQEVTGKEICGTRYSVEILNKCSGVGLLRPRLSDPLWQAARAALLQCHARAPRAHEVSDWLWGIAAYGRLFASPFSALTEGLGGNQARLREERYLGPQIDLRRPLKAGMDLTERYWDATIELLSSEWLSTEVRQRYARAVPNVDLALGLPVLG